MNLGEGIRRLALVMGAIGAMMAGVLSYNELRTLMTERAQHNRFDTLTNLAEVENERKCRLFGYESGCSRMPDPKREPDDWRTVPQGTDPGKEQETIRIDPLTGERMTAQKPRRERRKDRFAESAPGLRAVVPEQNHTPAFTTDPYVETAIPTDSEINSGGVRTIHWTQGRTYLVASFVTDDGETLLPVPRPSVWRYFAVVLFPIIGFLIPWGALRAIGWVGAGFTAGAK